MEDNEENLVEGEDENLVGQSEENDQEQENVKPTKQRSAIWKHFKEINKNGSKYACLYCQKQYKISGSANGSTGNMINHLEIKHSDKLDPPDDQTNNVFTFSQENFRKALLKWMIVCDKPFTTPQNAAFVDMMKTLNPDATLYSDKTMRADLLHTFNEKFNELKNRINEIPGKIAITMDGWTSKNVLPFLAIRAHYLDEWWNYQSQLLDFCHIEGSHSGATFKDLFAKALQSLGIPLDKIVSIIVDNASSNDTFFDKLEEIFDVLDDDQHIRCAQDVLKSLKIEFLQPEEQQPTNDELNIEVLADIDLDTEILDFDDDVWLDDEDDGKIVVKLRTLIRKIRKSVLMRHKLYKLCNIYNVKYLVPILDVKTRWNSTYDMILRAEHLKTPLKMLCSGEKSLTSFQITESQWLCLLEIKHLLQNFHRATQLVSMERHSTIHAYIPTLDWLMVSLKSIAHGSTGLVQAAKAGLRKLQKYHEIVYESKIPFIATFLNPALKLNYFKEHKYANSKIRVRADFPKLSQMARDILPIQSASVAVERDFSKGAQVVTPTRCSLISETIRETMFVKSWFANNP